MRQHCFKLIIDWTNPGDSIRLPPNSLTFCSAKTTHWSSDDFEDIWCLTVDSLQVGPRTTNTAQLFLRGFNYLVCASEPEGIKTPKWIEGFSLNFIDFLNLSAELDEVRSQFLTLWAVRCNKKFKIACIGEKEKWRNVAQRKASEPRHVVRRASGKATVPLSHCAAKSKNSNGRQLLLVVHLHWNLYSKPEWAWPRRFSQSRCSKFRPLESVLSET